MFNNYIAKKRELKLFRKLEQAKNQIQWKNKYRAEIQPELLQNYQQRVNSFMHQMHENPIIIEEPPKMQDQQARRGSFVYKNCEDWKSFQTVSERLYMKSNSKDKDKAVSTCRKVETSNRPAEYRIRNKLKEINQPMRFGKISLQRSLPVRKKYKSLQMTRESTIKSEESQHNENETSLREITSKESDANFDFFDIRGRLDDVQMDKNEDQRKKTSKQAKRHFKKLMALSLMGDQRHKKQIKSILNRCGYIKKKEKNHTEVEIDHLAHIIEKTRQK